MEFLILFSTELSHHIRTVIQSVNICKLNPIREKTCNITLKYISKLVRDRLKVKAK